MKLHRDLKITQITAWFMLHRLREVWDKAGLDRLLGPVVVDETRVAGLPRTDGTRTGPRLPGQARAGTHDDWRLHDRIRHKPRPRPVILRTVWLRSRPCHSRRTK